MRKLQTSLVLLSSLALIGACGDDDGDNGNPTPDAAATPDTAATPDAPAQADAAATTYTLTYTSSGDGMSMEAVHDGATLYLALWDDAGAAPVATQNVVLDANVALNVVFQDAMIEGNSYTLYYYADLNANGMCNGPAGNRHLFPSLRAPSTTAISKSRTSA